MAADRFSTAARLRAIGVQAQVYRATGRRPDGRPARRSKLTGRAALLALTVCALVVALAYPTRQYLAQAARIADQRRQAEQAQQQVDRLREQLARWSDPDYVRAMARARLHYVMPGETGYTMPGQPDQSAQSPSQAGTGTGQAPVGGAAGSASGSGTNRPWYDNIWESVNSSDAQH